MAFVVADRVQETGTVATGTGTVNLAGAVLGYQSFISGIGSTNTTYYTIYDPAAYAWEVGLGTVTAGSPNTLARTTVYANSAGTQPSKISFSTSNTLTVFVTYPAQIAIYTAASASLNSLTLTSPITSSSNVGALNYGTLSYSDTGIFTSYSTSVNSYAQMILQNTNAGSAASADYVVSANGGTATTNFGNFGINSTAYTGTGPLNAAGMVYLYSQSADLTIGTNTSHAIHFTINNAATDALTINTTGSIAVNGQTGSLGQILISQGSSNPPSWGNAGGNLVTVNFTATSGQTTFTTPYVVGTVSAYRNGVKLGIDDFTATNGSTVVLASGATVGDLIEIQSFTTLTLYSSITAQNFSGTGSQTVFTMNSNPANSASVLVAINGVTQDPANYTVAGTTLTFSTAPAAGTNNISVRYLGVPSTTAVSSFSAGTTGFSPTSAASGAVTLSGTLVVANGGTGLNTLTSGYVPYGNGTGAFSSSSTFTFNGTTLFSPNASYSGNLTFTGNGSKILGDFSNATLANRTVIQTSTTNASTGVYVVPNGTSTAASIQALNAATPTNASKILIATNGTTDVQLVSGINGSGTYLPLTFWNSGAEQMRLDTSGNLGIGSIPSGNAKVEINSTISQLNLTDNTATGNGNKTVNLTALKNGVGFHNLQYTAYQHTFLGGGSATQFMNIDTAGRVTRPLQPAFYAGSTTNTQTININTTYNVPMDVVKFNIGNNYNSSTYTFTAPVAGLYIFRVHVVLQLMAINAQGGGADGLLGIAVNGASYGSPGNNNNGDLYGPVWLGYYANLERMCIAQLSAGDAVTAIVRVTDANQTLRRDMCSFSGYML